LTTQDHLPLGIRASLDAKPALYNHQHSPHRVREMGIDATKRLHVAIVGLGLTAIGPTLREGAKAFSHQLDAGVINKVFPTGTFDHAGGENGSVAGVSSSFWGVFL